MSTPIETEDGGITFGCKNMKWCKKCQAVFFFLED